MNEENHALGKWKHKYSINNTTTAALLQILQRKSFVPANVAESNYVLDGIMEVHSCLSLFTTFQAKGELVVQCFFPLVKINTAQMKPNRNGTVYVIHYINIKDIIHKHYTLKSNIKDEYFNADPACTNHPCGGKRWKQCKEYV
jgi:hypothetical protein